MSYSYSPNKYVKYDNTKTFEENKKAGAVLKVENINALEEAVKKNSASLEIGEVTVVATPEEAKAEVIFDEETGVKRINLSIPQGPEGKQGKTPVKGEDYYTTDEKAELVEEIKIAIDSENNIVPYYDADIDAFFACGVHCFIYDSEIEGMNKAVWDENGGKKSMSLEFPYDADVYGGSNGLKKSVFNCATNLTIVSGKINRLSGGSLGTALTGMTNVTVNGGTIKCIGGGGIAHYEGVYYNNTVGSTNVIINKVDAKTMVYGSDMNGLGTVGNANVVINNGEFSWVTVAGSNGYTASGELIVNGGSIDVLQSCNRGKAGSLNIVVNAGTVKKLYAGGETEDKAVTAIYDSSYVELNGGVVEHVYPGTNGGVESSANVSGAYKTGVVVDESEVVNLGFEPIASLDQFKVDLVGSVLEFTAGEKALASVDLSSLISAQ